MIKYTKNNLEKLETAFGQLGYKVRYEKGQFQSGYCIVAQQKVVVINRFFDIQARIWTLLEILKIIDWQPEALDPKLSAWLEGIVHQQAETHEQ